MILVDTSVWIDHLRKTNEKLSALLNDGFVLTHPFVIGEFALGHLDRRKKTLHALTRLPVVTTATDIEVLQCIENARLLGSGIG